MFLFSHFLFSSLENTYIFLPRSTHLLLTSLLHLHPVFMLSHSSLQISSSVWKLRDLCAGGNIFNIIPCERPTWPPGSSNAPPWEHKPSLRDTEESSGLRVLVCVCVVPSHLAKYSLIQDTQACTQAHLQTMSLYHHPAECLLNTQTHTPLALFTISIFVSSPGNVAGVNLLQI